MVLAGGDILELGTRASKSSSGYDLVHLFVGSEGTLGVVVEATVRLTGAPEEYSAAVATFPTVEDAGRAVFELMRAGLDPAALELIGPECVEVINRENRLDMDVAPTLFMEFHGPAQAHLREVLDMAAEICRDHRGVGFRPGLGRAEMEKLLAARHHLGEMIIRSHPDSDVMPLDVAVPITAYPEMMRLVREELAATGLIGYTFSHAGDGNLHPVLIGKKGDRAQWEILNQAAERIVRKALEFGGTATGEHGVGLGKKKFMAAEHGLSLEWMKKVKGLFDPNGILNPGKIF